MTFYEAKSATYGSRATTFCLALALVAAGLVAGYTLSLTQQLLRGQPAAVLAHVRLFPVPHSYTVLSSSSWSRSQWGRDCSTAPTPALSATGTQADDAAPTAAASQPAAAEPNPARKLLPGTQHLCELPQIWSNCSQGIYLDVGTNVGVQLRKLYDPQQFPGAAVLPIFDRVFGSQRSGVCAMGVEANPHHTQYLEQLNGFFKSRGYQAVVLTETAASIKKGSASFFLDHTTDDQRDDGNPTEWAASLQQGKWHQAKASVPLLDLPSFIMDVVRPILLQEEQSTGRRPPVVMKLDVEGEEYAILPGLMLSGGLCELDLLFMEHHEVKMRSADGIRMKLKDMERIFARMRSTRPSCRVNITDLDDESYVNGKLVPLPTWHETPEQLARGSSG